MKVLIACEFSGVVRDAFIRHGHDAISCDLLPSDRPGPHIQGDVRDVLRERDFDLMIAHPPCTDLSVSGSKHFKTKRADGRQIASVRFFMHLARANVPRIAVENPISIMSTIYRTPDQIIQPWMFGHPENKATCLWLKSLPHLKPVTDLRPQMEGLPKNQTDKVHHMAPGRNRWKDRSITYEGIGEAMAAQWGRMWPVSGYAKEEEE